MSNPSPRDNSGGAYGFPLANNRITLLRTFGYCRAPGHTTPAAWPANPRQAIRKSRLDLNTLLLNIGFIVLYVALDVASFIHPLHGLNITPWNPAPALGLVFLLRRGPGARPVLVAAVLVFRLLGLSINTMTLGGLAIAIGELVDDAVVDVENVLRRLQENRRAARPRPALQVVARACSEVRSGVVLATATVVLVFVPLFALPGMEGRLFVPLGLAYIVAILASLAVAVTVTPVLCVLLLPQMPRLMHGDGWLVAHLKAGQARLLGWALPKSGRVLVAALALVLAAAASVPLFPRSFLPPFNEGTLTVNVILQPGVALAESERVGQLAETLLRGVPEVLQVGRRTGRAELDEHAEGVHSSELDVDLRQIGRAHV
mgnify:CR=1 FL=1